MADADPDPVVLQHTVFLNKKVMENLFVFQFPLYDAKKPPYDEKAPNLTCRMKVKQNKFELNIPLDTTSDTFDDVKAQELAEKSYGESASEEVILKSQYKSGRMDQLTLTSSMAPSDTHYCIGVLDVHGLHLTPINNVVQLRPSLRHLDAPESPVKEQIDENTGNEDEEPITVTVQTTRERKMAARKAAQAEPDEPWVDLKVCPRKKPSSEGLHTTLTCSHLNERYESDYADAEYLTALDACQRAKKGKDQVVQAVTYSRSQLADCSLEEGMRRFLCNAQVARLSTIMNLVTAREDDVVQILSDVAVLIHGNWVIKSEELYPETYRSPNSGAPSHVLRAARDFILHKLNEGDNSRPDMATFVRERPSACSRPQQPFRGDHSAQYYAPNIRTHFDHKHQRPDRIEDRTGYVRRSDVTAQLEHWNMVLDNPSDITDMLKGVASQVVGRGWIFKNPTDTDFMAKYPRVVERQEEVMKLRWQQLQTSVSAHSGSRRQASHADVKQKGTNPTAAGNQGPGAIEKVKALFNRDGVVTRSQLATYGAQNNISPAEMNQVLATIAMEVKLEWWEPAVKGEDQVYVLSSDDKHRQAILTMFCANKVIQRKDALDYCVENIGEELQQSAWTRITKELGVRKGGAWEFKLNAP